VLRIAYFKGKIDECAEKYCAGCILPLKSLISFLKETPGPRSSALKHKSKLPQQKIKLLNDLDEIYGKILRIKNEGKKIYGKITKH
jgi:hypothetical protein